MSIKNVRNILSLLAQLESLIGDYYLACAERWDEGSDVWESIRKDEIKHAEYINRIISMIDENPDKFSTGKKFNEIAIEVATFSALDRIRINIDKIKNHELSRKEALDFSYTIEQSVLEHLLGDIIETRNTECNEMINEILSDTERHRETFSTMH